MLSSLKLRESRLTKLSQSVPLMLFASSQLYLEVFMVKVSMNHLAFRSLRSSLWSNTRIFWLKLNLDQVRLPLSLSVLSRTLMIIPRISRSWSFATLESWPIKFLEKLRKFLNYWELILLCWLVDLLNWKREPNSKPRSKWSSVLQEKSKLCFRRDSLTWAQSRC
jgi:hypothetical protein